MNKNTLIAIAVYFAVISLVTVSLTVADKLLAMKNSRRVPEKVLFIFAFLGGSAAEYITMKIIRHKTLHKKFMIGLPIIILFQLAVAVLVALKINQII